MLLRLPAFVGGYFPTDESLYMLCAEKILQGKALYSSVWYSGQPLIVWFYALFVAAFGSFALWALRIFTILYIYFTSLYFGIWLSEYRPFERYALLPSFLFIVLSCSPWYALELMPELLMLLPMMFCYRTIVNLSERRVYSYQPYFVTGMLMMMCVFGSFHFFLPFLALIVLYLILKRAATDELTALLGGAGVMVGIMLAFLYFTNSLGGYLDMALLYGLDLLRYEMFNDSLHNLKLTLWGFFTMQLLFVLLAILGFVRFRFTYFTSLIKIRRLDIAMTVWAVGGFTAILLSLARTELHEWILISPPLAFYATKAFEYPLPKKWLYPLMLLFSFLPIAYNNLKFWTTPNTSVLVPKEINPIFENQDLKTYFANKKVKNGIWLMEYKPETYLALNKPCATKYVDYRIVYQKFHPLPYASTHLLISRTESEAEIYKEFEGNLPDYVIDKQGLFPNIREMYPVLFYDYKPDSVGAYRVYYKH